MTPYSRMLLGIKPDVIFIPRRLIFPKTYLKLIKKYSLEDGGEI